MPPVQTSLPLWWSHCSHTFQKCLCIVSLYGITTLQKCLCTTRYAVTSVTLFQCTYIGVQGKQILIISWLMHFWFIRIIDLCSSYRSERENKRKQRILALSLTSCLVWSWRYWVRMSVFIPFWYFFHPDTSIVWFHCILIFHFQHATNK